MKPKSHKNEGVKLIFSQEYYLPFAINSFLQERKAQNLAIGTQTFYRKKLAHFQSFCESQHISTLAELTPDVIRFYLLHLEETGHNPGGIHAGYRTVRAFLYWWEREYEPEGWKNPIRKVKSPKLDNEPLKPLDRASLDALVATCDKSWYGKRDKAIMLTLFDSGLRAAELCSLNIADIDTASGEIEVRKGKGRKPRVTFVGRTTLRAIRQWIMKRGGETGAFFITHEGDRLTYWGLREIIRRRAAAAEIPRPAIHDFRRAFCLGQLQAGVPETTIARLMGHTTTQLIARYARQTGSDLKQHYHSLLDE